MKGIVVKSTGSWYLVRGEDGEIYSTRLRGKFKLHDSKITNPIAVGDQVKFDQESSGEKYYVISEVFERTNYVIRKSPKKAGFSHILAANIDQALILATIKQPKTSLGFIDRFLVTTESYRIPSIIVFNKFDLLNEKQQDELFEIMAIYESIGYKCYAISLKTGFGLDDLDEIIKGKLTLVAGHSGTGKSTLINQLTSAEQQTSEISDFAQKGVHTTTFAEMFPTKTGGYLIDTPGIKELGLTEIEPEELSHYFPEMRDYLGKCKFHNCMHIQEPGCLVGKAVEAGDIPWSRYESYLSMLENEDNRR
jgi:ribosome biogenesis GTPase